jgi:hypothetical protein
VGPVLSLVCECRALSYWRFRQGAVHGVPRSLGLCCVQLHARMVVAVVGWLGRGVGWLWEVKKHACIARACEPRSEHTACSNQCMPQGRPASAAVM